MQLLPILAVGGVAGMAILLVRLLESSIERQVAAFTSLLGGYRADGWPQGVQEEDRDRPWGRTGAAPPEAEDGAVTVDAVRPVIRLRS
jgi:hypothetical protein